MRILYDLAAGKEVKPGPQYRPAILRAGGRATTLIEAPVGAISDKGRK